MSVRSGWLGLGARFSEVEMLRKSKHSFQHDTSYTQRSRVL